MLRPWPGGGRYVVDTAYPEHFVPALQKQLVQVVGGQLPVPYCGSGGGMVRVMVKRPSSPSAPWNMATNSQLLAK